MRSSRYWLVVATVCVITGYAGPFGLQQVLPAPQRILFWSMLLVPVIPFVLGLSLVFREMARQLDIAWGWAALTAGGLAILPVSFYSTVIDTVLVPVEGRLPWSHILASTSVPLIIVTVVANAFFPTLQPLWGLNRRRRKKPLPPGHEDFGTMFDPPPALAPDTPPPALPRQAIEASPLFERLPSAIGQDVVCIRADNHHIEVTTPLGTARVLMRLGDAEADLAAFPGIRVHRSWWVNMAHVRALRAAAGSGGGHLLLSTGAQVPVSRGQRAVVIEAMERLSGGPPADMPQPVSPRLGDRLGPDNPGA